MNQIIKYINENEIELMVAAILKQGKDIDSVIRQIKDSRVEYQAKSQELQWALEKHIKKTSIVNKHHKVPFDIYIGRGSKWGNPFSHMEGTTAQYKVSTRDEAVEKYREWILTQPELLNSLHELKGKTLCCYCKPKSCHGDFLIELIER